MKCGSGCFRIRFIPASVRGKYEIGMVSLFCFRCGTEVKFDKPNDGKDVPNV